MYTRTHVSSLSSWCLTSSSHLSSSCQSSFVVAAAVIQLLDAVYVFAPVIQLLLAFVVSAVIQLLDAVSVFAPVIQPLLLALIVFAAVIQVLDSVFASVVDYVFAYPVVA